MIAVVLPRISNNFATLGLLVCFCLSPVTLLPISVSAQSLHSISRENSSATAPAASVNLPKDYVIGVEDILNVVFWSDKELSAEVVVRPDGKISLPMLNDVPAAGMTPEQLAAAVQKAATKFVRDPGATVIVKQIHSRKVYVVGEVAKPGAIQLGDEMNVLQAIAEAGGFLEHANKGAVVIVRNENGQEHRYRFNYNDVVRGRYIAQNIRLLPGDTILIR
ncbi:MAG TPA: polysaccharide biosynthesis/export family protein [Vicinamibacterales bacterium]|nr:polysaccharide biosynthesis/export family protein [Vicinamibacterales bacterium]